MDNDAYFKQGNESLISENHSMISGVIQTFPEARRRKVEAMLDALPDFFLAPASSRRSFHSAFPGGLADHSLRVTRNALSIAKVLAPKRWPDHKLAFCALFHDLGKANCYARTKEDWKWRRGEFYDLVDEERMQSGEASLYLLQRHGIELDYEETLAIRLTDGPQEFHLFREPPLSLIIGWADRWAMVEEKEADR